MSERYEITEAVARLMADVDASEGWREANPDEWKLYIDDVPNALDALQASGFKIVREGAGERKLSENELYYLRSIYRNLKELGDYPLDAGILR